MDPHQHRSTPSSYPTMESSQTSPVYSPHPSPAKNSLKLIGEMYSESSSTDSEDLSPPTEYEKVELEETRPSKRLKSLESMDPDDHGSIPSSTTSTMKPSQCSLVYVPSPPMDSIISIREIYENINPVEQIAGLVSFVENQLDKMDIPSEAGSSSSEGWQETIKEGTKFAAMTIDTVCTEAGKVSDSDAVNEVEMVTEQLVQGAGELHLVFIGVSLAAYAVENYLSSGSMEKECRELLLNILQLAKDVKENSEQVSGEKLCIVVGKIVKAAVIFCDYLNGRKLFRVSSATTANAQLEETNNQLKDIVQHWRTDYPEGIDVFLSHSGAQKDFVRQLHRDLTNKNVSCFFDQDFESLPPGEKFAPRIFSAAQTCKVAVVVISEEFIKSKWPMLELSTFFSAKDSGKNADLKLLPIFFKISPGKLKDIINDSKEWEKLEDIWKNFEKNDAIRGKWKYALKKIRSFNGSILRESEVDLRDEVVGNVCRLLGRESSFKYGERGLMQSQPKRLGSSPSKLLDFQPEGIEDQIAEVKKLLNIGGSDQAIAVVIVGFGGVGKSTLAAAAIDSLNLSDFKFSKVTVDEKTLDKNSHIAKLQSHIITHFTGEVLDLQDPEQGRKNLKKAMAGKSCFLYIDNIVDSYYIKELLPRELLPQKPSEEKSSENLQNEMQKTKIRILITSRQNDLRPLLGIKNVAHQVQKLSALTAEKLLSRTILKGEKPAHVFDEECEINKLAEVCKGVPLLLTVFGNHIKDNREKDSYKEAIQALNDGNIDRYGAGYEELLSRILMYVYDKMDDKDKEAQEAFLDICAYFHGRPWNLVADIMGSNTLSTLHNKMLVNKSEAGTVIVHDILRLMGAKKCKDPRLMKYEEIFDINDDESKLRSVKGMHLGSGECITTLHTSHLNAMRQSLRVLVLGDWVRVEGTPCEGAFKNLRYLKVGDLKDFPFKDVSKMEKLNVFLNSSKAGMELAKLPRNLKYLSHQIPPDCNEFARLPLENLKGLKTFMVQSKTSVRLPQACKLPVSLQLLFLNSCEQLPETSGHLSALQTLDLDKCQFKCLPQEFIQSVGLRYISMRDCTNVISLADNKFASLSSLRDLDLTGCTSLEKLPSDLGTLSGLQDLNLQGCKNLSVLPENFGGLKSLKRLVLKGLTSLQSLPHSFVMLSIEHLRLESLDSLKELPQSMGYLSCLKTLGLISCPLLESVPDSFSQLTNLDALKVMNCTNLSALPKSFDQLCSLKEIEFNRCPSLTKLPDGFGKLKRLKRLIIFCCYNFQTLPQGFEKLDTLERLDLLMCPMLEGTAMDSVVKLQNCDRVDIRGSPQLIERWNEMDEDEESKSVPMLVIPWNWYFEEKDRVRRLGLLCGTCIEVDSTTNELIHRPSISIPNNTTLAVISLPLDEPHLLQQTLQKANERARRNCGGELRIIYVCRKSDATNEEDETGKIRQALTMLPQRISYAIPSTDTRRLSLIGTTIFYNEHVFRDGSGPKLLFWTADIREGDKGRQNFMDEKCVEEDKISQKSTGEDPVSENSDEETEICDEIVEFINCICKSETQRPSGQCSSLPEENVVGEFIQKLKNNNIDHFSDNKVKVEHLQGKTLAIILIDQNYPECKRLKQIYQDIKLKDSNFEAIWIPEKLLGFGSYNRVIQFMPWLTLADPKLIEIDYINDRSPRVIIINSGGSIGNPNALAGLMSRGADAYPFTKGSLSQLDLKSSLEILFHSKETKVLNNKVIFLYAEPYSVIFGMKMKSNLKKLVRIHGKGNFEVIYIGCFFGVRTVSESQEAYENVTKNVDWTNLSFWDAKRIWYGCKYLSDEVEEEPNSASTLNRVLNDVVNKKRWLVVIDGDGIVTAHGIDVVEMACESSDDEVKRMMREEIRESLKEGKCREWVRRYFRDEIQHPQHHHPLRPRWGGNRDLRCNGCDRHHFLYWRHKKRIYRCEECNWDLCWDCWKEFVKDEVRRHATEEG